jgi:gliding motility-associated lipoprotein GldD
MRGYSKYENNKRGCHNRAASIHYYIFFISFFLISSLISCRQKEYPRPYAYARIEYPDAKYDSIDIAGCPFGFEYPAYATVEIPQKNSHNLWWLNIRMDKFHAILYTSCEVAKNTQELNNLMQENESLIKKQLPPYSSVKSLSVFPKGDKLTGFIYQIDGATASPVVFTICDNKKTFFRGSLYFDYIPNKDSISDILAGMTKDLHHLIKTFYFK